MHFSNILTARGLLVTGNEADSSPLGASAPSEASTLPDRKLLGRSAGIVIAVMIGAFAITAMWPKREDAPTQPNNDSAKQPDAQAPLVYTSDGALLTLDERSGSVESLTSLLSKAEWPTPRDQFETSVDYRKRLARFDRPIGRYARTTPFVVIVPATARYEADTGALTLQTSQGNSSASPAVVLESNVANGGTYVGENAFGVKAPITQTVTTQTIMIPIGSLKGPAGCHFQNGKGPQDYVTTLTDGAAFIDWACGRLRYIDKSMVEDVSSYKIQMDRDRAREISTRSLKFAYIVSFASLPTEGSPLIGPMDFTNTQPTLNNPHRSRVTGFALTARLQRVVIYTMGGNVVLDRKYN